MDLNFLREVGSLDGTYNQYARWLDSEAPDTEDHVSLMKVTSEFDSESDEEATGKLKDIILVDHNMQAFSYYWFRKNLHKYEATLNQIGCEVGQLCGGHPSEWDYTKIAAPLFLEEKK